MPKTDCLVIKAFNGDLLVTIDKQILELKELSRNERFSKEFDEVIEVKEKKKYIPPMTHPWKLSSFLKQIEKSHNQHQYAWVCFYRLLDTKNILWKLMSMM